MGKNDVLNAARLGFEFEFISPSDYKKIARKLSEHCGVRVLIPEVVTGVNKYALKYHTGLDVTDDIWKLEIDYSGGDKCYELITGAMSYKDAIKKLGLVLNWLSENAITDDRCAIHVNMSYDETMIKLPIDFMLLNTLKFCLNFDEDKVYKAFPKRRNSVFAKSIKKLCVNYYDIITDATINEVYIDVPKSKYYGVNFSKLKDGYIEFRYMGGNGYEKKKKDIIDNINYFILYTFSILENNKLNDTDYDKIKSIYKEYQKFIDIYKNVNKINELLPDVDFTIDLLDNKEIINTYWSMLRNKIINILVDNNLTKCSINYNSDISRIEIKNAEFKSGYINNVTLYDCSGNIIIQDSDLIGCDFVNSHLVNCELISNNTIKNSKVEDCIVKYNNKCINCYINSLSKDKEFHGKIEGGIIRNGFIGEEVEIGDDVIIISMKKISNKKTNKK